MGLLHETWWIYILRCSDDSLYTGITNNIVFRYWQHLHMNGGCKYTRSRQPVFLVQCWTVETKSQALRMERLIKRLKHADKELLVSEPGLIKQHMTKGGYDFSVLVDDHNTIKQLTHSNARLTRQQAKTLNNQRKT
ncbi:MAG: GIY-YIG nuclease family protein [Acidobacteriota bacterium]